MNSRFILQCIQLSCIWIVIGAVPIGRILLVDPYPLQIWFYFIILILGLIFIPFLIIWLNYLQRKKYTWVGIILIQLFLSIFISLLYHYENDEGTASVPKRKISSVEFDQMQPVNKMSRYLFSGSSYTVFTSIMILSGIGLLIGYNEQLRRKKNAENELKIDLVKSQIKALQSELQPHFLFNTLHAASSLMEVDIGKAQQLIERLSFLLRNYLDIIDRQFYSLEEELAFVRDYIEIQQLRHNGSIILDIQVPFDCIELDVPVVLLQPILENSIKHGWVNRKKELRIVISAKREQDKLSMAISDNGSETVISQRSGIGIRNLKERLAVLYGDAYSYSEERKLGYFSQIILPIKK